MIPSKTQWKKWSLPSKLTAIGVLLTIVGVVLSSLFWVFPFRGPTNDDDGKASVKIKNEIVLSRLYDKAISHILIVARFESTSPEDISPIIFANNTSPIRFDFSRSDAVLTVSNHKGYRVKITPASIKASKESGFYSYVVDLNFLRRLDPEHPLSNLSLRQLDGAPVQVLLHDKARERMLNDTSQTAIIKLEFMVEVEGYHIPILSEKISAKDDLKSFMPREVPGKPGFVMMIIYPEWKISVGEIEKARISFSSIEESVSYLERQNHINAWRGIWPDDKTLSLFHTLYSVPIEEKALIFHPWNQHFVRLRHDFAKSGECRVPGISVVQLPEVDRFYVFTQILYDGSTPDTIVLEHEGTKLMLTLNEVASMHNMLRQMAILNTTWVEIEGNYVHGLVALLPKRGYFVQLSSKLYIEFSKKNPPQNAKSMEKLVINAVKSSVSALQGL